MSVIRNSPRAFIGVLFVFLAYHGVMSSLGLATFVADKVQPPTPDRLFQIFAQRVVIDGSLLFAGHWLLRSYGIASRLGYALMGGAAMAIGYAFALSNGLMMMAPLPGAQATAAILPALIGIIAGSMYAQFAGREFIPGRKSILASSARVTPAPASDTPPPVIFNGPVRVRTSMSATLIAAVVPAGLVALIVVPLFSLMFDMGSQASANETLLKMALPSHFILLALIVTAIPAAVFTQVTHAIARAMNRTRGVDYAVTGAVVVFAVTLTLLWLSLPFILLPLATIAGALMGAVYRRFAGIEPLPLPEAVLATDASHLVAADHPTRQGHTVIMNG